MTVPQSRLALALLLLPLLALGWASGEWMTCLPILAALALQPLVTRVWTFAANGVVLLALALPLALLLQVHDVENAAGTRFNSFYLGVYAIVLGAVQLYRPSAFGARSAPIRLATGKPSRGEAAEAHLQPVAARAAGRTSAPLARVLACSLAALAVLAIGLPSWASDPAGWLGRRGGSGRLSGAHLSYLIILAACLPLLLATLRSSLSRMTGERSDRRYQAAYALVLAGALGLGGGGAWLAQRYYHDLLVAYLSVLRDLRIGAGPGFSERAELGSIMSLRDPRRDLRLALRAFAPRPPGYLRGRAYLSYHRGAWSSGARPEQALRPAEGLHTLPGGLRPPPGAQPDLRIHPVRRFSEVFFLPLEAGAVATDVERLREYATGILQAVEGETSHGYGVFLGRRSLVDEAIDPAYKSCPEDSRSLEVLDRIVGELSLRDRKPAEAVQRLQAWFRSRYRYQFGIEFHGPDDPLVEFLTEKSHGHCELFASAGTLLLRRARIAARYVTGFVCLERQALDDGVWVARGRDAHAWVEYYDPQRGWQTAEFTPPEGLPQIDAAGAWLARWEYLEGLYDRLSSALRGGLAALPDLTLALMRWTAAWFIQRWWRPLLPLALIALYLASLRRRSAAGRRRSRRVFTGPLADLHRRYLALERSLARRDLGRLPCETLLEYAGRLEGAPLPPRMDRADIQDLLRRLAELRYGA